MAFILRFCRPIREPSKTAGIRLLPPLTLRRLSPKTSSHGLKLPEGTALQSKRMISARLAGLALALAVGCGLIFAPAASAAKRLAIQLHEDPELDDILITPSVIALGPGESVQLTATGQYDDESTADITDQVVWTTRDDGVVTVSATGLVEFVAAGSTEIEAEEPVSGVEASQSADVEAAEIDDVTVTPAAATVEEGDTVQLTALADLSDGRTGFDVTEFVDWTSNKVAKATVSNVAGSKGLVSALQEGEVLIRAKDPDSGTQSPNDEGVITIIEPIVPTPTPTPVVTPTPIPTASPTPSPTPTPTPVPTPSPAIERIDLIPLELEMLPNGDTETIQAIATLEDGTTRDVTGEVEWVTNRDQIATVVGGVVTSGESGTADIDVHHEESGVDAEDVTEVWVGEAEGVVITPVYAEITVASTVQLTAHRTFDNGLSEDITTSAIWHSEKDRVATVSNSAGTKGLVTGAEPGDAVIVATDPQSGEESDSSTGRIDVIEAPAPTPGPGGLDPEDIDEINILPQELNLVPDGIGELRAVATLEDGSEVDITDECEFLVDKEHVASAAAGGFITGLIAGQTKVDAYHPESDRDAKSKAEVWVGEVESIDLSPTGVHILLGDTVQLAALATYDNGLSKDITQLAEWSSEKTRVATVSDAAGSKGFVTAILRGDAVIVARDPASGKKSKASSGKVVVVEEGEVDPGDVGTDTSYTLGLQEIVLDPLSVNVMPGGTDFLTVTGIYADGSTRDLTEHVLFEARRETTAKVDELGVVTGVRGGDTEVRAEEPITGLQTRVATRVFVAQMTSLEIWPAVRVLGPGQTLQLLALASYDNGVTDVDVTDEVLWSTTHGDVAEVDGAAPDFGLLRAFAIGETDITAEHPVSNFETQREDGLVQVTAEGAPTPTPTPAPTPTPDPGAPAHVVGQEYAPWQVVLEEGESAQIVTSLVYSDESTQVVTEGLEYTTDDFRVAVVSGTGLIVAKGTGVTTIQILDPVNGFGGTVAVQVREITSLTISPATTGLRVGGTAQLEAIATYSDGETDVDVTPQVEWRSNNPFVVSVDENGLVTALAEGTASIEVLDKITRVRSDASTGMIQVVGDLIRVFLTPSNLSLPVGGEKNYKAFGVFADGTTVRIDDDVLWSIDAGLPPIATIDENGRVTAHLLGDAMVHATDLVSGISSADTDGSRPMSVVAELVAIRIGTNTDLTDPQDPVVLSAGETKSLKAAGVFAGRTDAFSLGSSVDWFSSNPAAVSVTGSGLVTCLTVGVASISAMDPDTGVSSTATLGDLQVTCSGAVLGLRTTPDFRNLDYLDTRQLRAYRILEDGSEVEVTRKVIWTSSAPSIVSIVETGDEGGLATALDDGEATLIAYDEAFDVSSADSGQVSVIRTRKTRILLELFPEDDGVGFVGNVGEIFGFQARVTYASGATQGVNVLLQWSSSDPTVVLMGDGSEAFKVNQGLLQQPGTVTITATYPADAASANDLTEQVTFTVLP